MDELVNTRGRGSLGTPTNSPVSDINTMARTQNRPSAPQGGAADPFSGSTRARSLTQAERDFISEIHRARNFDGSPLSVSQLQRLRVENARLQAQAAREFGPGSTTALYYQDVVAAYDERIADATSPMGSAIDGLRSVLADKSAKEKDRREKVSIAINILHDRAITGKDQDDDPKTKEAMGLILDIIKVNAREKRAALNALVQMEKRSPGSVSDAKFGKELEGTMEAAREEAMFGGEDDDENEDGSSQTMSLAVDSLNLVADRRIVSLKNLIEKDKQSPGSVSDQQFVKVVESVIGDERQREMLSITKSQGSGMELVAGVMKIFLERRRVAIADLFKRQKTPGSGVTNQQVNQALADYEIVKSQARQWGVAVPNAPDIPDVDFKTEQKSGEQ